MAILKGRAELARGDNTSVEARVVSQPIGARHSVIMLHALLVLGLGWMLVLRVLLIAVKHIGHASPSTIQPSAMALLMILRVHAVDSVGSTEESEGGCDAALSSLSMANYTCRRRCRLGGGK